MGLNVRYGICLKNKRISLICNLLNQSNDSRGFKAAITAQRILFFERKAIPDELYMELDKAQAVNPALRERKSIGLSGKVFTTFQLLF